MSTENKDLGDLMIPYQLEIKVERDSELKKIAERASDWETYRERSPANFDIQQSNCKLVEDVDMEESKESKAIKPVVREKENSSLQAAFQAALQAFKQKASTA